MFNNVVLDVFIGLIFLFLLYSLLATVIQEIIANFLALRARMLSKGIKRMLEDGSGNTAFHAAFYNHPAIKYLAENNVFNKPAYIEAQTFAQTLIHLLRGNDYTNAKSQMDAIRSALDRTDNGIAPETLMFLKSLYIDAHNDIDEFRTGLEKWYNDTMDRVAGWYKRQTQWILIGIGLALAAIGNIDVIKIYGILSKDKDARAQMVNMAIASQKTFAPFVDKNKQRQDSTIAQAKDSGSNAQLIDPVLMNTFNELREDADKANDVLGLGYHKSPAYKKHILIAAKADSLSKAKDTTGLSTLKNEQMQLENQAIDVFSASSIPGFILLALAVSLGAPFWFDLLNKFINLRNAGVKPADSTESNVAVSLSAKSERFRVVR